MGHTLINPSKKSRDKGGGSGKYGRNKIKCERYRRRVGKPHFEGNKAGKNRVAR